MKSIELLFAAWFLEQNDIKRVEDAVKIFRFVDENIQNLKLREVKMNIELVRLTSEYKEQLFEMLTEWKCPIPHLIDT